MFTRKHYENARKTPRRASPPSVVPSSRMPTNPLPSQHFADRNVTISERSNPHPHWDKNPPNPVSARAATRPPAPFTGGGPATEPRKIRFISVKKSRSHYSSRLWSVLLKRDGRISLPTAKQLDSPKEPCMLALLHIPDPKESYTCHRRKVH